MYTNTISLFIDFVNTAEHLKNKCFRSDINNNNQYKQYIKSYILMDMRFSKYMVNLQRKKYLQMTYLYSYFGQVIHLFKKTNYKKENIFLLKYREKPVTSFHQSFCKTFQV